MKFVKLILEIYKGSITKILLSLLQYLKEMISYKKIKLQNEKDEKNEKKDYEYLEKVEKIAKDGTLQDLLNLKR